MTLSKNLTRTEPDSEADYRLIELYYSFGDSPGSVPGSSSESD